MANFGVVIDGTVLHELRKQRMWSLKRLARQGQGFARSVGENSGLGTSTLCRAEHREGARMSENTLRYLVGALGPSRADLHRLLRGAEPPDALVRLCSDAPGRELGEGPASLAAMVAELTGAVAELRDLVAGPGGSLGAAASWQGDNMLRFQFLRRFLPGVLGAAFVPWSAVERLCGTWRTGVDESLVAAYEDMAGALWRPYRSTPEPKRLLVAVGHEAAAVREVLRQPMTGAWRQRLYEVSVGLHAEAGMLGLNLHELGVADGFFALARAAAQDSGSGRLQAQALQVSTHMLSSLRFGGDGGDDELALTWVEQAGVHAVAADAHTRAETWRRIAEHRALDGDELGFRLALEEAHEQFGRVDGSETGFSARSDAFLGPDLLHAAAGMGYMVLGRNGEALGELRAAVSDPVMSLKGAADMHADMARVWVQLGDPERACAELTAALDLIAPTGYKLSLVRVRGVRASFPPEWAGLACVRDLDSRLRAA